MATNTSLMRSLILPPEFNDADINRRAAILFKIIFGFLLLMAVTYIIGGVNQPQLLPRYVVTFLLVLTASSVAVILVKKRYFRTGAIFYVVFMFLVMLGSAWTGGGIRSHAVKFIPIIVLFAGLILERNQVWIFGGAGCIALLLIVVAENAGILGPQGPLGTSPWIYLITTCSTILILCYLEHISIGGLNRALQTARREIELRKQSEEEILKLNELLEIRIEERTSELIEKNLELDAYNRTVSHDLQQPLTAVNILVNTIQKRENDVLGEKSKQELKLVAECTEGMQVLVKELLNMSAIMHRELSKQLVDMKKIVLEVWDEVKLEENTADLVIDELPAAFCDPILTKQIWRNLISNSVKYSKKHTRNRIEIGSEQSGSELIFFVKDNGIGFNMDEAGKLFTTFGRLHRDSEFEGTGIGLSTVQRIVLKHHGRIWATAKENEGANFYFTLG